MADGMPNQTASQVGAAGAIFRAFSACVLLTNLSWASQAQPSRLLKNERSERLETQRAVKKPGEGIKNRPDLCGRVKMALLKAAEPARAEKTALQPVASAIFRVPKLSLFLEFCLFEHPSLIAKMQHVFQQSARASEGTGFGP